MTSPPKARTSARMRRTTTKIRKDDIRRSRSSTSFIKYGQKNGFFFFQLWLCKIRQRTGGTPCVLVLQHASVLARFSLKICWFLFFFYSGIIHPSMCTGFSFYSFLKHFLYGLKRCLERLFLNIKSPCSVLYRKNMKSVR